MPYLLNAVYLALIFLASPWLAWAAVRHGKYREGFSEKFFGHVPKRHGRKPCIWLHAVSVGEVNLLATLLKEMEARWPDVDYVISTTTKTGYELAKKKYAPRSVFYCPLDFSWAVSRAMQRVRPDLLVLAELELWPNLIRAAKRQGVKVAIVNGRLSEKSFRGYRRVRWLVGPEFSRLDTIAVQNETYAARFRELIAGRGETNLCVTGSVKFDGAETNRANPKTRELVRAAGIADDDVVFLAGSTQAPEEELALAAFRELQPVHPNLRLVIVPRHKERFEEVARVLEKSGLAWQRRSELAGGANSGPKANATPNSVRSGELDRAERNSKSTHNPLPANKFATTNGANAAFPPARVLLVDTIGELGAWWGTADVAFVGGSLGTRGGQNMIEPAAYGAAVCFGPKTQNFRDIVALLLGAEGAQVVHSGEELTEFVRRCLEQPTFAAALGQRAQRLVQSQLGATARTVDLLAPLLGDAFARRPLPVAHRRVA